MDSSPTFARPGLQMTKPAPFIDRFGLWTAEQARQARALKALIAKHKLKLIRLVWSDTHGHARTKEVTIPAFLSALSSGYNINVATTTLDASGARTFASFTPGGGMGLEEMTGSPNLTIVPDPATFRVLPWAPGIGWVICDEYFNTGIPFHFSPRQLLKKQLARLKQLKFGLMVGLEVEWYLLRLADDRLAPDNIGQIGIQGKPTRVTAVEPGYSYHSESNFDIMQPVLTALCEHFEAIDLPLRSIREQIASAFDLLIQQARLVDGSRRVTHVTELIGMESDVVTLQDIFLARPVDRDGGGLLGPLQPTGLQPHFLDKLAGAGVHLPPSFFEAEEPPASASSHSPRWSA